MGSNIKAHYFLCNICVKSWRVHQEAITFTFLAKYLPSSGLKDVKWLNYMMQVEVTASHYGDPVSKYIFSAVVEM